MRGGKIPGVTGKKIPGAARLPPMPGGFNTNVPFQEGGSSIFREYHRQQVRDTSGRFAGGWGFAWQGVEAVADNLQSWMDDNLKNLHTAAERLKDEMVEYAKENAPWTDHPGENQDARKNLQGAVVWNDETNFTIFLGHGKDVYYGIWLEVRWGGRYAIIVPTIQHFAPFIGDKIRTLT